MKRRANGEGSIFKRKNGRWEAQAFVTLANGEHRRVCLSAKSQEVIRAKLKKILEQEDRGQPYSSREWSVAAYVDYWLNEIQTSRIRETTLDSYRRMIKNYIKPTLGGHFF